MQVIHAKLGQQGVERLHQCRERIEVLSNRVDLLKGTDRLLMTMHLQNGNSYRQMAQLLGMNEVNVARRIRKITQRLLDGRFIVCLRNRDRLTRLQMKMAKDYLVRGFSIRQIAQKRNYSYYRTRMHIQAIHKVINPQKSVQ